MTLLGILGLLPCYAHVFKADSLLCDSTRMSIYIDCVPTLDGTPLQNSEMIIASFNADSVNATDTISYDPLSPANTLVLDNITIINGDGIRNYLSLSVYSVHNRCYTSKVTYHVNDSISDYCNISIDALNADSYIIGYPDSFICMGPDSVFPVSDVPNMAITFNSDSLLCMNPHGVIVPADCQEGEYTVHFSSDFCLASAYFNLTLSQPETLNLPDTLPICSGDAIDRNEILSGYTFYSTNDSILEISDSITDGTYYVSSTTFGCSIPDTVYVEIVESPVIGFNIDQECDRWIVSLNETNLANDTPNWTNGIRGYQVEIDNDTVIGVSITNTDGCVSTDSVSVRIKRLEVPSVDFSTDDASCWYEGNINIASASVNNNVGMVRYQLHNILNDRIYNQLDDVPEGVYDLQVIDERNCTASYEQPITIRQRCLEDYPVFTPNGDDIDDSYFIPYEGTIKIFDINGSLIRQMNTPAYWDGTDDAGNALPMGTYVIITDKQKIVNITIIK